MSDVSKGFNKVRHGIPDDSKLASMSFADLAVDLSLCIKDSPKFTVIERELKKRIAQDQAKINRPNMLYAACVGGAFALTGVVLGYYLKNDVPPGGAVQKVEKSTLAPSPSIANIPASQPPISPPAVQPAGVQNNAQPSRAKP